MVTINNLTFNQDYSCISISTNEYHKIFNCDPFGEFYSSNCPSFKKSLTNSISNVNEINYIRDNDEDIPNINTTDKNINQVHGDKSSPTSYLKMLFSTSLTIIIPQSNNKLGNRLLKIYNLKQRLKICELTFPSNIIDIKLNRKRLVVFLEIGQIYIYDLSCVRLIKVLEINSYLQNHDDFIHGQKKTSYPVDLKQNLDEIFDETNHRDLVGDLSADDSSYLVLPLSIINEQTDLFNNTSEGITGLSSGSTTSNQDYASTQPKPSDSTIVNSLNSLIEFTQKNEQSSLTKKDIITLDDLQKDSKGWILIYDTIELKPKLIYKAHDSSIAKISVSNDSCKIATASTKGTIIRICQITKNEKLKVTQITNLRRGHNLARINELSFNLDNSLLGCGSESNTIHFFDLRSNGNTEGSDSVTREEGDDDDKSITSNSLSQVESESVDENEDDPSSEDLNENLANLLISKRPSTSSMVGSKLDVTGDTRHKVQSNDESEVGGGSGGYFSLSTLKKTTKLINNQYTKSIIKKLPYKDYFDNLIWEPPKRSFAFIKLPEYAPPPPMHSQHSQNNHTLPTQSTKDELRESRSPSLSSTTNTNNNHYRHKAEIGFTNNNIIMLASYQTGTFYHYQLPKKQDFEGESREECYLINQFSLV